MEGEDAPPPPHTSATSPTDPAVTSAPAEGGPGGESQQQNKSSGSNAASEQSATVVESVPVQSSDDKSENGGDSSTGSSTSGEGSAVEVRVPREHGRLDVLLSQIPKKAQHGLLMQCDLVLTCIDANQHYIALGTNIGLTFLYNRHDHTMQRLRSETSSDVISCVKLHDGLDHQLAAGMASGSLCIFFIPGSISATKTQLQKFDVRSLHHHYVTCVAWSTNGMKLFSGDKSGQVVVTEVDFYQGQCKSSVLLVEPPTEVVQLHYDHRVLLVSTRHRSFLCRLDTTGHTVQIGQKDRKVQGNFGAVLIPGLCKVEDAQLFAVRPGCRIWLSDIRGNVLHTHMFKELLCGSHQDIPLLQPVLRSSLPPPNPDLQFGRLHLYSHGQLLTFTPSSLYILHPDRSMVVGSQSRLGGIVDVAVHQDEVFVLRRHSDSAVVRFAYEPEALFHTGIPPDSRVLESSSSSGAGEGSMEEERGRGEENKAKQFFKKTFLNPFKKLDTFLQEHAHTKEAAAPDLRPVIRSADHITPDLRLAVRPDPDPATPKPSSFPVPPPPPSEEEDCSPDLPPVVALDSPELAVRVFSGGLKGSGSTPGDVQSPDSAHSALSVFAEEVGDKAGESSSGKVAPEEEGWGKAGEGEKAKEDNQDIVFSHHMHKKKAKKKKGKGLKVDGEADTLSQSSLGSQAGEDRKGNNSPDRKGHNSGGAPREIDNILRQADEALNSVDRLLNTGADHQAGDAQTDTTPASVTGEGTGEGQRGVDAPSGKDQSADAGGDSSRTTQRVGEESRDGAAAAANKAGGPGGPRDEADAGPPRPEQLRASSQPNTPLCSHPAGKGGKDGASHARPEPTARSATSRVKTAGDSLPAVSAPSPHSKDAAAAVQEDSPPAPSGQQQRTAAGGGGGGPEPKEGEDPMVAAERTLDSMTRRYKFSVKKEESVDDFYSMFTSPYSPTDPLESPPLTPHLPSSVSSTESERQTSRLSWSSSWSSEQQQGGGVREGSTQKLANTWSEFTTPANMCSLALSSSHVWFTDKSENLYYSALGAVKGIVWRKVGEQANQISVSPSGHIVWRLHRGRVFAGTKITQRRPEGLKWVEAVNNVAYVAVDDHCAWYIKSSGEVMMQRGLSKERPCFRSLTVETEVGVQQIVARYGVVWAITDSMTLLVRTGISNDTPQGLAWQPVNRQVEPCLFCSVTVDNEGMVWALDVLGQLWFTDHVTPHNPVGSGTWWQVPLSENLVQDAGVLDLLRSLARKKWDRQALSQLVSSGGGRGVRGGLSAAGSQGVWLALDFLNTLHVCRGSLQGYQWSLAQPSPMSASTSWKQVSSAITHLSWGMVWAQQVNGEVYAIPTDCSDATLIPTPATFLCYSVNEHSVWGLTGQGALYVRSGMGQHCPLGVDWAAVDLLQLGEVFLVHVSCNDSYVWTVDSEGRVFHRIGAAAPRPGQLNPVWLPIDVYTEIVFTKVVIGPLDWMVWAVDNRRLTYVRVGVGDDLPIGKEWIHVPGIQAMDVSVSGAGVWALNTSGEILFRYGITPANVSGNYWKKIPGCFTCISASYEDRLWAVHSSGQLVKCSCRPVLRRQESEDPLLQRSASTNSEEGEWVVV